MRTKIILELGCNHNGSIDNAKKMIDEAAELGVWAVKLQKRDVDSIPFIEANQVRRPENSFGPTYYEHRKALEFNGEQVEELLLYAEKVGIGLGVTVFDEPSLIVMSRLPLTFIKLPSQLFTNVKLTQGILEWALLDHGGLSMASTGMHTVQEIINCNLFGYVDVTMYCRSIYPCTLQQVRLGAMREFFYHARKTGTALGYSSHEIDGAAIPLAVVLGAEYIERHYTLDKTMKGSDHSTVSSTRDEMKSIIDRVKSMETITQDDDKLCDTELRVRKQYRGF